MQAEVSNSSCADGAVHQLARVANTHVRRPVHPSATHSLLGSEVHAFKRVGHGRARAVGLVHGKHFETPWAPLQHTEHRLPARMWSWGTATSRTRLGASAAPIRRECATSHTRPAQGDGAHGVQMPVTREEGASG